MANLLRYRLAVAFVSLDSFHLLRLETVIPKPPRHVWVAPNEKQSTRKNKAKKKKKKATRTSFDLLG